MSSRWFMNQRAHDVAVRRLGVDLQQQAFLQVARADAGRVELLNGQSRVFDLVARDRPNERLVSSLSTSAPSDSLCNEVAVVVDVRDQEANQLKFFSGDSRNASCRRGNPAAIAAGTACSTWRRACGRSSSDAARKGGGPR